MKHPSSSDGYTAGHLNVGLPSGYYGKWKRDYEDEEDDDKYVWWLIFNIFVASVSITRVLPHFYRWKLGKLS